GYYLLGLSRPAPASLRAIPRGTPRAAALTLAAPERAGFPLTILAPLADLDERSDLAPLLERPAGALPPQALAALTAPPPASAAPRAAPLDLDAERLLRTRLADPPFPGL